MKIEFKWTIPNLLSLLRLLLLPVFVTLYVHDEPYWAFGVLVLSGVTDSLDGIIARRCNQITDLGKLLDPVADKITQVTVVICLATRYPALIGLVVICLVKEMGQAIGALFLLRRNDEVRGARWFGKVSTFVFYGAMALIVLIEDMPAPLFISLIVLVAVLMLVAFIGYMKTFIGVYKTLPPKEKKE